MPERAGLVRAVLDANVLYPQFLRDVFLRLAASDLYLPHWSDRIQDEWIRNVVYDHPDLSPANFARTRAKMDEHFPGARVVEYEVLERHFEGVHPKDRHVAAAALRARAERIVTLNLKDFPAYALEPHGIVALHPDEFICNLARADRIALRRVLEAHRVGLQKPPHTTEEYVAAFQRAGLGRAAVLIWP